MQMWQYIGLGLLTAVVLYLAIVGVLASIAAKRGSAVLYSYATETATLSYGDMTYIDEGPVEGEVIFVAHGLFGGYDQGFNTGAPLKDTHRVLAPSRFGYPGSDVKGAGTPKDQAAAFVELLDELDVDKVYVLGASAGGTPAIRFALDYPERCKGLILYSSAAPRVERPEKIVEYQGPPAIIVNDFFMYLFAPLFKPLFGMDPDTINNMMPISERSEGVGLDAAITNPDMERNYDDYPIEQLKVKTLVFASWDDATADSQAMHDALARFPDATSVFFDDGGHMMEGHGEEIETVLKEFIEHTRYPADAKGL